MGAPTHPDSTMGPLISARQLQRVEALVQEAVDGGHAAAVAGCHRMAGPSLLDGADLSQGYYYAPSVLASREGGHSILQARIWREEAFGPVVVVVGFDSEDEAVALANDSDFGLGAAIWTQHLSQAYRVAEQMDAGIVWVNTHHRNDPSSPWGGAKTASGVGSENGVDAYHAYTTMKSTIINYASAAESLASDDWFREGTGDVRYG
ncbi:aldehyde dehydrogenase [Coniella lustricola]|uniref:aldehyde dehydrogenase (NAD(+)) n=1 Tax=Coniella lustricola TaxID=2025994 RepID=A0A2T3A304_9PEZI|nr:aldehyde dehydrogenase [Coniella lustricola]